jgi:hypothetical protein
MQVWTRGTKKFGRSAMFHFKRMNTALALRNEIMPGQTISFIDEDELQLYKLYRDRVVQEDNVINHRMTWMVLSQAFLTAFWAGMALKYFDTNPSRVYFQPMSFLCGIGFLLALSSKLSIRAAQDEISALRDIYTSVFEYKTNSFERSLKRRMWVAFYYIIDLRFWPFNGKPECPTLDKRVRKAGCAADIIPGLTGSNSFHYTGHLLPKLMPILLMTMWFYFLYRMSFFSVLALKLAAWIS